jgi:hypothetical protein
MKKLNTGHIYKRNLFKVETGDNIGSGWPMGGISTGNSGEDNQNYSVEVTGCHGDEIPSRVIDAKDTAELMAKLLNYYFLGYLFVGNPRQIEMFKTNLDDE